MLSINSKHLPQVNYGDGESPWEQECNCNNEHGRSGRVEGDADFENHYMFALNKKIGPKKSRSKPAEALFSAVLLVATGFPVQ